MLNVEVSVDVTQDMGPKTRAGIVKYLKKGGDKGAAVARDRVPVDRGAGGGLLSKIFDPVETDDGVVWGVSDAPHARPIEEGTAPFHPPVQPLVEWAQRVAGDPGLGYYVALHKIPEEGITAQPYVAPGVDAQRRWYRSHDASSYVRKELE